MDNLIILESIGNNILSFSDDNLKIDDRYFLNYREKYCTDKITNIIEESFNKVISEKKINLEKLKSSLNGLNKIINNNYYTEEEKIKFLNLYNKLEKNIKDLDIINTSDSESIDEDMEEMNIFDYLSNYLYDSYIYFKNILFDIIYK